MGNCLVTKLKSVINNDNLDKIGVFKIWFKHPTTTTGFSAVQIMGMTKAVIVEGESNFCNANGDSLGKEVTKGNGIDSDWDYFRISNAVDCTIEIYSKYELVGSIDQTQTNNDWKFLVDYKYCHYVGENSGVSITTVQILRNQLSELKGVLDTITKDVALILDGNILVDNGANLPINDIINAVGVNNISKVKNFVVISRAFDASIASLSVLTNLTYIKFNNAEFKTTGELKTIGNLTQLTYLQLALQNYVNGSLEEFVQAQIAAGRTTGEIALPYIQITKVTWKGSQITGDTNKPKVSWTADSITYYADGTTPDTVNL